jgi:hypothetical protein
MPVAATYPDDLALALVEAHPLSPFRSVSWRWRLAGALARHDRRLRRKWVDAPVRRAARYLRRAARLRGASADRLARIDPVLDAARRLWLGADPRLPREIEARLLAAQDVDTIARRTGVAAAAIRAGADLFFDIESSRACPDHFRFVLVGEAVYLPEAPISSDAVLKLLALAGGPVVVDAILDLRDDEAPICSDLKALIATMQLPVTPATSPLLVRLAVRAAELDDATQNRRCGALAAPVSALPCPSAGRFVALEAAIEAGKPVSNAPEARREHDAPGSGADATPALCAFAPKLGELGWAG